MGAVPWWEEDDKLIAKREKLAESFSPGAPVGAFELFFGRNKQMNQLIGVARQRGQHAVVFGERGVGKTSLATIVAGSRASTGHLAARMSCANDSTFASIWDNALEALRASLELRRARPELHGLEDEEVDVALEAIDRAAHYIEDRAAMVADVCNGLRIATAVAPVFVVIDEFDRVADDAVTLALADLVKMLSDEGLPITVVIVGVADNVADLLGEHPSIGRSVKQVYMPRMEPSELEDIVNRGLAEAEIGIAHVAVERIVRLSHGLPHYTHQLGQLAGNAALDIGDDFVDLPQVDAAVASAMDQALGTVSQDYENAVSSPQRTARYREVLLACSLAKTNHLGEFRGPAVRDPLSAILQKRVESPDYARHIKEFCSRGVLEQKGTSHNYRYRFRDPLLQPYVIMRGLHEGNLPPGYGY